MTEDQGHVTLEGLVEYFAGDVDDGRQEAIEVHLAGCDQCADLARRTGSIFETVGEQVDGWTAASHAAAVAAVAAGSLGAMADASRLPWGGVQAGERIGDSCSSRGCGPFLNPWPKGTP